jgi:UPF0271 protein
MARRWIDLNCDLGESAQRRDDGTDLALLGIVTSANIACGGHAGDERTMLATALAALDRGVAIGAHPGYPDRDNFGRVRVKMTEAGITGTVFEQIAAMDRVVRSIGGRLSHVKPHGTLYHDAMGSPSIARAIGEAARRIDPGIVMVGMAGAPAIRVWRESGFRTAEEAFAERAYEPNGTLRKRTLPGALITDPSAAAAQTVRLALAGAAQTLCVHSDTPAAVAIARAVRKGLEDAGIHLRPLGSD